MEWTRPPPTGLPALAPGSVLAGYFDALVDRFLSKVEPDEGGCWLWCAGLRENGYGQFSVANRNCGAHRVAYELFIGPIPDGHVIDHSCRTKACVNPAHLEAVTPRENTLRGDSPTAQNASKTHCYRGHPLQGNNLLVRANGTRWCRECRNRHARERWRLGRLEAP